MAKRVHDDEGDTLDLYYGTTATEEREGLYVTVKQTDGGETHYAGAGPFEPHHLIELIKIECEDAGETGPITREVTEQLVQGEISVPFRTSEEAGEAQQTEEQRQLDHHAVLADHWQRRMDVVRQSLACTARVTDALKIARFVADDHREIPGVDR